MYTQRLRETSVHVRPVLLRHLIEKSNHFKVGLPTGRIIGLARELREYVSYRLWIWQKKNTVGVDGDCAEHFEIIP
jgi:hypothetical protein